MHGRELGLRGCRTRGVPNSNRPSQINALVGQTIIISCRDGYVGGGPMTCENNFQFNRRVRCSQIVTNEEPNIDENIDEDEEHVIDEDLLELVTFRHNEAIITLTNKACIGCHSEDPTAGQIPDIETNEHYPAMYMWQTMMDGDSFPPELWAEIGSQKIGTGDKLINLQEHKSH